MIGRFSSADSALLLIDHQVGPMKQGIAETIGRQLAV